MAIECLSAGILFADVVCEPIDHAPEPGELVRTERIHVSLGGCASNVAIDLARLDVEVGLCGCVGDDALGDFIRDSLSVDHIDTSRLRRKAGTGTGTSMIINVEGQDRRFVSTSAANLAFSPSDIPEAWISQARVFYLGGFFMMPGLETDAMRGLFRAARQAGTKTVLDVVLYGDRPYAELVRPLLPETDFVMPNSDEARVITGRTSPVEQARWFLEAGAKTAVITLGDEGALLMSREECLHARTYPANFVGGAGAGDAFDAGFIMGLLQGSDMAGCLRWGSALGASCVAGPSATETVFTRQEAMQFMQRHPLAIETVG